MENQYNLSTNLILKPTFLKHVFCQTIALINRDGGGNTLLSCHSGILQGVKFGRVYIMLNGYICDDNLHFIELS
jgi:hypothetical protein